MTTNLSENIRLFQKRWNAKWDDATAFAEFKNRLLYLIDKYLLPFTVLDLDMLNQFAYYCGLPAPYLGLKQDFLSTWDLRQKGLKDTILYNTIANSQSPIHLAWFLQNLFLVLDGIPTSKRTTEIELCLFAFLTELKELVGISPSAQIRLSTTQKGVAIYPAGAKLLDEGLVNDNISWLEGYPESLKAFEQSLSIYLRGDKPKFRNLIDNLRVSIELLLRKVLNNQKSLENQSKELDAWLEKHGSHKQIRNLYGQLLFGPYAILQNDVAKHGDVELLPDEIEYLIYITGTFMRLIIQLRRSEA